MWHSILEALLCFWRSLEAADASLGVIIGQRSRFWQCLGSRDWALERLFCGQYAAELGA